MKRRQSRAALLIVLGAVCVSLCGVRNLGAQDSSAKPSASTTAKPKLGYTISKETTFFTGPLKDDGTIDFVAAVNEHFAKGVTPENNAAVVIAPLFDHTWTWGTDERREEVLGAIGLKPEEYAGRPTLIELRSFSKAPGGAKLETVQGEYNTALEGAWPDDELPLMRRWLDINREPMSQIVQATKRDRYFVPFVPWDKADSLVNILLEHTQAMREVARMFEIRANNHMANNRWDEAWNDILTIKDLGQLVAQGQTLVEGLVGIAITGIACDAANRLIAIAPPAEVDWTTLRSHWKSKPVFDVRRSLGTSERAMLIQLMCNLSDQPDPNALLLQQLWMNDQEFAAAGTKLVGRALQGMLTSGEVNLDDALRYSNKTYDRAIEAVSVTDAAAREAAYKEIEDQIQIVRGDAPEETQVSAVVRVLRSQPQKPEEQFANVLLGIVFPAAQTNVRAEMRIRASQNVVDLALAAREMQIRTGHLPQSLRELEPFVEEATVIQPSTGDPIAFRADEEGILIYHWSVNRKDDGGILDESGTDWGIRIEK